MPWAQNRGAACFRGRGGRGGGEEEERGGSRVTRYLTQEGLQVIPVQNRLMTSRIVPRLDPRKIGGQPNFHTSAGVITAEAGLPTEGAGLGAVAMPARAAGAVYFSRWGPGS